MSFIHGANRHEEILFPERLDAYIAEENPVRILLANLLQSSRSTFSPGSLLSFFAFNEGMLDTQIAALGGWPTVSGRYPCT